MQSLAVSPDPVAVAQQPAQSAATPGATPGATPTKRKSFFSNILEATTQPKADRNDPFRFQVGLNFRAKIIGISDVPEARGDRMCQEAIQKQKLEVKAASKHKQPIIFNISLEGIRIIDQASMNAIHQHAVHRISFISRDVSDARAFGYIYGSGDGIHKFFGIKTEKAAEQTVLALRDLFQVVFELKKKETEQRKQAEAEAAITIQSQTLDKKESDDVTPSQQPARQEEDNLFGLVDLGTLNKNLEDLSFYPMAAGSNPGGVPTFKNPPLGDLEDPFDASAATSSAADWAAFTSQVSSSSSSSSSSSFASSTGAGLFSRPGAPASFSQQQQQFPQQPANSFSNAFGAQPGMFGAPVSSSAFGTNTTMSGSAWGAPAPAGVSFGGGGGFGATSPFGAPVSSMGGGFGGSPFGGGAAPVSIMGGWFGGGASPVGAPASSGINASSNPFLSGGGFGAAPAAPPRPNPPAVSNGVAALTPAPAPGTATSKPNSAVDPFFGDLVSSFGVDISQKKKDGFFKAPAPKLSQMQTQVSASDEWFSEPRSVESEWPASPLPADTAQSEGEQTPDRDIPAPTMPPPPLPIPRTEPAPSLPPRPAPRHDLLPSHSDGSPPVVPPRPRAGANIPTPHSHTPRTSTPSTLHNHSVFSGLQNPDRGSPGSPRLARQMTVPNPGHMTTGHMTTGHVGTRTPPTAPSTQHSPFSRTAYFALPPEGTTPPPIPASSPPHLDNSPPQHPHTSTPLQHPHTATPTQQSHTFRTSSASDSSAPGVSRAGQLQHQSSASSIGGSVGLSWSSQQAHPSPVGQDRTRVNLSNTEDTPPPPPPRPGGSGRAPMLSALLRAMTVPERTGVGADSPPVAAPRTSSNVNTALQTQHPHSAHPHTQHPSQSLHNQSHPSAVSGTDPFAITLPKSSKSRASPASAAEAPIARARPRPRSKTPTANLQGGAADAGFSLSQSPRDPFTDYPPQPASHQSASASTRAAVVPVFEDFARSVSNDSASCGGTDDQNSPRFSATNQQPASAARAQTPHSIHSTGSGDHVGAADHVTTVEDPFQNVDPFAEGSSDMDPFSAGGADPFSASDPFQDADPFSGSGADPFGSDQLQEAEFQTKAVSADGIALRRAGAADSRERRRKGVGIVVRTPDVETLTAGDPFQALNSTAATQRLGRPLLGSASSSTSSAAPPQPPLDPFDTAFVSARALRGGNGSPAESEQLGEKPLSAASIFSLQHGVAPPTAHAPTRNQTATARDSFQLDPDLMRSPANTAQSAQHKRTSNNSSFHAAFLNNSSDMFTHASDVTTNMRNVTTKHYDVTTKSFDVTTNNDFTTNIHNVTTNRHCVTTNSHDVTTNSHDVTSPEVSGLSLESDSVSYNSEVSEAFASTPRSASHSATPGGGSANPGGGSAPHSAYPGGGSAHHSSAVVGNGRATPGNPFLPQLISTHHQPIPPQPSWVQF